MLVSLINKIGNLQAWENFFPAKRDPSSAKEGPRLAAMKHFTCNRRI